jgi:hypothetical protein
MLKRKHLMPALVATLVAVAAFVLLGAITDVTYDVRYRDGSFASGTLECDADVATNICIGFQPSRIEAVYADAEGDVAGDGIYIWSTTMGAGYFHADVDSVYFVHAGGPPMYAGASDSAEGFVMPAGWQDVDSDMIHWTAWR